MVLPNFDIEAALPADQPSTFRAEVFHLRATIRAFRSASSEHVQDRSAGDDQNKNFHITSDHLDHRTFLYSGIRLCDNSCASIRSMCDIRLQLEILDASLPSPMSNLFSIRAGRAVSPSGSR